MEKNMETIRTCHIGFRVSLGFRCLCQERFLSV